MSTFKKKLLGLHQDPNQQLGQEKGNIIKKSASSPAKNSKPQLESQDYLMKIYRKAEERAGSKRASDDVPPDLEFLLIKEMEASDLELNSSRAMRQAVDNWKPVGNNPFVLGKCEYVKELLGNFLRSDSSENNMLKKWNVVKLWEICDNYQQALEVKILKLTKDFPAILTQAQSITDPKLKSLVVKYNAMDELINGLKDTKLSNTQILNRFNTDYALKKEIIASNPDAEDVSFLKLIATFFTKGYKAALNLSKSGQEVSKNIAETALDEDDALSPDSEERENRDTFRF